MRLSLGVKLLLTLVTVGGGEHRALDLRELHELDPTFEGWLDSRAGLS
jgi:hypothetical protein